MVLEDAGPQTSLRVTHLMRCSVVVVCVLINKAGLRGQRNSGAGH